MLSLQRSAGVGLWNSNSQEERPTSVTPNPAAAAHSLFLILLLHFVRHLRMLDSEQCSGRQGGRQGRTSGGRAAKSGFTVKESGFAGDQRKGPHRFKPKP